MRWLRRDERRALTMIKTSATTPIFLYKNLAELQAYESSTLSQEIDVKNRK